MLYLKQNTINKTSSGWIGWNAEKRYDFLHKPLWCIENRMTGEYYNNSFHSLICN